MKKYYLILLITLFACEKTDDRPNILFIMSDDHAYQAISAYDDKLINTPNIDRLADEGILYQLLQCCIVKIIKSVGA